MNRVFRVLALVAMALPMYGMRSEGCAAGPPPKPSDRSSIEPLRPAMDEHLTVDDVNQMREESWKKPHLFASEFIDSIVAEAYGHPLPVEDVPPFVIPKKYHEELLKHFREAELDKAPWQNDELGTIRIRYVGGASVRICWFWAGQGSRLHFSFSGMRYVATGERFAKDETLEVDALVRRIQRIEVFHEDGTSVPFWLPPPQGVAVPATPPPTGQDALRKRKPKTTCGDQVP